MLVISKDKNVTVPGGWRDVLPVGNGQPFVADNFDALVEKERKFLRTNALEVPENLAAQIEDRICHRMPEGICHGLEGRVWHGGFAAAPSASISNTTITLFRGRSYVSMAEANQRAAICHKCGMSQQYKGGCASCKGIKSVLDGMTAGRSALNPDPMYRVCDALGVFLKVLVHLNLSTTKPANVESVDEGCWLKEGSGENG